MMRSPANQAAPLLDDHFVWEQKSGSTVFKLHQQHSASKVVDGSQNARFFAKSAQTFMVSDRSEHTATPPHRRLKICAFHVHRYSFHPPIVPARLNA
jgi:hypothetical protein